MDEDLSPVAGTSSTKAKGNCVERKCISFYIGLAEELARLKLRSWMKEKESEENRGNWDFRPILERLEGKGLKHSEGTSSIAQWRSQLSQL